MRKHKSVVAILLAVMMIFTFMPTMAFAQTLTPDDFNEMLSVVQNSSAVVEKIDWGTDYHTAKVAIKYDNGNKVKMYDFEAVDFYNGMEATRKDYADHNVKFVVMPQNMNGETTDFRLAMLSVKKDGPNYDYEWDLLNPTIMPVEHWTFVSTAVAKEAQKNGVYDPTYMDVKTGDRKDYNIISHGSVQAANKIKMDAGKYSAWFALKDAANDVKYQYDVYSDVESEIMTVGGLGLEEGWGVNNRNYFTAEYPTYDAYEFDQKDGKNVDKELEIKVTLNADAIKAQFGSDVLVSTAARSITLVPQVGVANHPYFTEYKVAPEKFVDAVNDDNDEWTYDGQSHSVTFAHMPKSVKVKYFIGTPDKNGYLPTKVKDSEWTDTFAGIKDVGVYRVFVKFITEKDGTEYILPYKDVKVVPFQVAVGFKQLELNTEYGKYDATSLEKAVKELIIYAPNYKDVKNYPDSADKIAQAINYSKLYGLFTDAGKNYVYADIETADMPEDLKATLKNYDFVSGYDYYETDFANKTIIERLTLFIQKVSNDVQIKAPSTKTFKANKKTKKLAKNKSFTISATARMGSVSFSKLSGNNKIKVSKTGKITVKKGLKKGKTYKIKVKALARGTANYAQAYQKKTIAIKIK